MTTLILTCLLMQSPQTGVWPVRGIDPDVAEHLQKEVDRAKDSGDMGRMILLWSKVTSGTISEDELKFLRELANRKASRKFIGPDEELYYTLFAGQLLNLHDDRCRMQREIEDLKKEIQKLKNHTGSQ